MLPLVTYWAVVPAMFALSHYCGKKRIWVYDVPCEGSLHMLLKAFSAEHMELHHPLVKGCHIADNQNLKDISL